MALSTDISTVRQNPQALANGMLPPAYTLPDSTNAATGLRSLQETATGGLNTFAGQSGTDPQLRNQPYADALYGLTSQEINRQGDQLGRDINEGTFGRGVGLSTITGDMQERLGRERLNALGNARLNSEIAAGGEARADQASALNALNAAFGAGTTGLANEANVGMTNTGRTQQANTAATASSLADLQAELARQQQQQLYGQGLTQQSNLQQKAFENQSDIASKAMLAGGLTQGLAGLGNTFGATLVRSPNFQNFVNGLFS